jgi:hypothetical protein
MMMQCSYDDISSIESSTCRISKHKDEVISAPKAMILSLSDAVSRLACTLQSKEQEMKVRERTESDYESKCLSLMIENAELKNQLADVKDGLSLNLGQQSTKPLTATFSTDDGWSSQPEESFKPFDLLDEQIDERIKIPHNVILSPPQIIRRKSMMNLSNLNVSPFRTPLVGRASSRFSTAHSLFTSIKGKKVAWMDKRPKLIPRNICFTATLVPVSDEVSDISV